MQDQTIKFEREIKKGVMEMLVLELLNQESNYGYEILNRFSLAPNGKLSIKEGTLYPILYRLEEEECLTCDWKSETKRTMPKKIYKITQKGKERLREQKEIWIRFQKDVSYIQNGKEKVHETDI